MKKSTLVLASIVFALLQAISGHAAVIFSDGFESGNFSSPLWLPSDSTSVSVSTDTASAGSRSAKFTFPAASANSFAELRFDLKDLYPELWIKYMLYYPSNYSHQNSSPTNNKFIRLWGNTYDDYEKIGASTWYSSNGNSTLQGDWNSTGGGMGPSGQAYSNFVTATDRGKWMEIKIHVKAATASAKGTLQIWKNGTLIINNSGTVNSYNSGNAHAYRYGYLLGWSNAGFAQTTNLYIDDVVFATAEADLGGVGGGTQPSAPSAPAGLRTVP